MAGATEVTKETSGEANEPHKVFINFWLALNFNVAPKKALFVAKFAKQSKKLVLSIISSSECKMSRPGPTPVVGIETLEHAQSVLKSLRSRSSSARNYQTMEAANLADGQRGLQAFNNIIVEKGKEEARKQEERQKELAMLDLIGNPAGGGNSPGRSMHSHAVNHTLRSDRYELSPSKLAALAKVGSLVQEGALYGGGGGGAAGGKGGGDTFGAKMERMAINRPRAKQGGSKKAYESKQRDSDDDLLSDDDDDATGGPGRYSQPYFDRADTPPKSYDDMPKYDSDDDVEPLTAAERGVDRGNSTITKNKAGVNQGSGSNYENAKAKVKRLNNTSTDGFMRMNQGTTSKMTNGVKNQLISPHSSPDGGGPNDGPGAGSSMGHSSSRVSINNPVEATSAESQEFADGLKYMMEASLNEGGGARKGSQVRSHASSGSVAGNMGSSSGCTVASSTGSSHLNTSAAASKSVMAMDIAKHKGAVLKKGGVFVRAGGARKARQAAEANM